MPSGEWEKGRESLQPELERLREVERKALQPEKSAGLILRGVLGWSNNRNGLEFYRYHPDVVPRHDPSNPNLLVREVGKEHEGCPVIMVVLDRAISEDGLRYVEDMLRESEHRPASQKIICWWWPIGTGTAEGDIPVPYERRFGDEDAAIGFARSISVGGNEWVKVFAAGDENDVRYRWEKAGE